MMRAQLVVAVVVEALNSRVLDRPLRLPSQGLSANHERDPFGLAVDPGMVGLREAMFDPIGRAHHGEAYRAGIDGVAVPRLLCELNPIIRQNRVDLAGHCLKHVLGELLGGLSVSSCNDLNNGELERPVDSDEQKELALGGCTSAMSPLSVCGQTTRGQRMWMTPMG